MRARWLALALLLSGCGRYRADLQALCDAERIAPQPGKTRLERLDRALIAMEPRMQTSDGKTLAARLMGVDVDPGKTLAAEAKRAGVGSCALADAYLVEREHARWEYDLRQLCGFEFETFAGKKFLSERAAKFYAELAPLDLMMRRQRLAAAAKDAAFVGCAQAGVAPR